MQSWACLAKGPCILLTAQLALCVGFTGATLIPHLTPASLGAEVPQEMPGRVEGGLVELCPLHHKCQVHSPALQKGRPACTSRSQHRSQIQASSSEKRAPWGRQRRMEPGCNKGQKLGGWGSVSGGGASDAGEAQQAGSPEMAAEWPRKGPQATSTRSGGGCH